MRRRLKMDRWDALAALANVIFALALLPTVLAAVALPVVTSIATIVALLMLQAILMHFRLRWGAVWNAICCSMWVILLIIAL